MSSEGKKFEEEDMEGQGWRQATSFGETKMVERCVWIQKFQATIIWQSKLMKRGVKTSMMDVWLPN